MTEEDRYTYNDDGSIETIDGIPVEEAMARMQDDREAATYAHLYDGEDYRTVEKRQLLKAIPRFFQPANPLMPRRLVWPWLLAATIVFGIFGWYLADWMGL